jgi:superfamily II DNA/RNA helicase
MYALKRTIVNFRGRIEQMQSRLGGVTPDADGLKQFLLLHYGFESGQSEPLDFGFLDDQEAYDEDYEEEDDDDEDTIAEQQEKRQQLRRTIDLAIERLQSDPTEARRIYNLMWSACDNDLMQLQDIQDLLADEFIKDHKREQVTAKVRELVSQGHKVLLISTFSDTVLDYYRYMAQDSTIVGQGIGMAIGTTKRYFPDADHRAVQIAPHNVVKAGRQRAGIKRLELFRLFAPVATCRNPSDRPSTDEEIQVLIGSETLSVGQNLQDADYLINIDLPWNPMTLEQRIGRIDRPKQHHAENIYIYYANSESQLLRQASRLSNLNKKLIGADVANQEVTSQDVPNVDDLGASIYGDTLFDDTILPGYVDFIRNLVATRRQTQESFQETLYRQQETSRDLYTQQEIIFSEDISQRLKALGDDYQANPIALGRRTGEKDEAVSLAALLIQYFGPNGEPVPDRQELVFWNDQTIERDAYGIAISTAFKTPEAVDVFSARYLRSMAQTVYTQLVALKNLRAKELSQVETIESVTVTSERLNKIQKRISTLDSLPDGLDRKTVKDTLKKLNTWKGIKSVQKLLRNYTDGVKAQLETATFVAELVKDTDEKNLILSDGVKPTMLSVNLLAILLRA